MLPSCGHFKNIPCPFYKLALCVRPHCPYKHQSADNGHPRQVFPSLAEETESLFDSKLNLNLTQKTSYDKPVAVTEEKFTYIPTPVDSYSKPPGILKSSNANLEKPSTSFVPVYKPTPISKLKDCGTTPTILSVKSIKSEYSPEFPTVVRKKKNVEEYDPTEVKCIPKKSVSFVDPASSGDCNIPVILLSSSEDELDDSENAPKFSDDDLEEVQPTPVPDTKTKVPKVEEKTSEESEVEEIPIDEYSVVDKILVDCKRNEVLLKKANQAVKLPSKVNGSTSKVNAQQERNKTAVFGKIEIKSKNINTDIVIKTEKSAESLPTSKSESEISKSDFKSKKDDDSVTSKVKKSDSHKKETKTEKSEKPREKSHRQDNVHSNLNKDKAKKDHREQSDKSKHSKKSIEIKKPHSNDRKVSKTDKILSSEHSNDIKSSKPSNHASSDKKTSKKRTIEEEKGQRHNSNNDKNVKRKKCFEDALSSSESSTSVLKEKSSNKHSSGVKRKTEISDSDSEHRNSKHKSVSSSKKTGKVINSLPVFEKSKSRNASSDSKSKSDDEEDSNDDIFSNCDTLLSSSESDPDEECRRIFEECYPESSEPPKEAKKEEKTQENAKKATELVILRKKRFAYPAASDLKKPASIRNKTDVKRPMNPAQVMFNRFAQCQSKLTTQNENRDSASDASKSMDKKRLNFLPNHNLLAAMKNKVSQSGNSALSKFSPLPPTVSKTLKVTNRVAHIPEAALKPRPIIPADFGCKVPSNVRQKFLNAFIDECLKFCPSEDEAYDHAIEEEKKAYDRSSSRSLYMNVAANTLKRLRNQAKDGPQASPSKNAPARLEKKTVSHETVLNGPLAQRTSFSIGPKKQTFDIKDLGGAGLYEHILQYVLTPEQLKENGFPHPHPVEKDRAVIEGVYANRAVYCNDAFKRICCRCQKTYYVNVDGDYVRDEECDFHWGRLWKKRIAGSLESRYSCCQGDSESEGCCVSPGHVFEGSEQHALKGFVRTLPKTPPRDNCYGIYALDCEMCYTSAGMELTRVTVIDSDLKPVYESFVKPAHKVLDYNTRFSGITEENLQNVRTSIHDVQAVLLCIFNNKTILIGHSLESDFKALKLFHNTVVDTSVVYPHKNGLPFKRALRTLMAEKLNKIIQNDVGGHDSHEDAAACMELMLWKIKEDLKSIR